MKTRSFITEDFVEIQNDVEKLAAEWRKAKDNERKAIERRLIVESKMIDLVGDSLPIKGTLNVGPIKIRTDLNQQWDQAALTVIHDEEWSDDMPWPFRTEWKPDNQTLKVLREKFPAEFERLGPALTEVPKKPSFSVE